MKRLTLFDKGIDNKTPHHYETFGGKRHRVYGRRLKPSGNRGARPRKIVSGESKSTFTLDDAVTTPLNKSELPLFFYAFSTVAFCLGLMDDTRNVNKAQLDTALEDVYKCCEHGRPFFMGDHAERILKTVIGAHREGNIVNLKTALRELLGTFHQTVVYLFDSGQVDVIWK